MGKKRVIIDVSYEWLMHAMATMFGEEEIEINRVQFIEADNNRQVLKVFVNLNDDAMVGGIPQMGETPVLQTLTVDARHTDLTPVNRQILNPLDELAED